MKRKFSALGLLGGYIAGGAWALFGTQLTLHDLCGAWPFAALGSVALIGAFKNI